MRKNTNEKLEKISQIPELPGSAFNNIFLNRLEQNKVKDMKNLQEYIAKQYTSIMANIAGYCVDVKGKPPCRFCVVGLGSLARQEITPYSDFEHIIVLENKKDFQQDIEYFKWFSIIFYIIIINVQETIIPSLMIESLNGKLSVFKNGFFDTITTRGISFDGVMPHACKHPLGRVTLTKDKPW